MKTPLYEVKARLSEYVTKAENGETVEITKHGSTTAVLISFERYNKLCEEFERRNKPVFIDSIRKWRQETGGLSQEEAEEFCSLLEHQRNEKAKPERREASSWR